MSKTMFEKLLIETYVKICKQNKISGGVRRNPTTNQIDFKFTKTAFTGKNVDYLVRNGYTLFSYNNIEEIFHDKL